MHTGPTNNTRAHMEPKAKIFICTPMYGGMCAGYYTQSLINLVGVLSACGYQSGCSFLFNESLITRARNLLAHNFLQSDFTHLMFIDADIKFDGREVPMMIEADVPVICGIYPKKEINWPQVKKAVDNGVEGYALSEHTGSFVVNLKHYTGDVIVAANKPAEIWNGGTGFMLIKREVFEQMKDKVPHYTNDVIDVHGHMQAGASIAEFFTTSIEPETNRLLSEDYHFCRICRENDIKIYAAPWLNLGHLGSYLFEGKLLETDEPCTQD